MKYLAIPLFTLLVGAVLVYFRQPIEEPWVFILGCILWISGVVSNLVVVKAGDLDVKWPYVLQFVAVGLAGLST